MRVPCSWLKEYCDPGLGAGQIAHELAMSGTEPERIVRVGIPSEDGNERFFRIGRVVTAEQHPDAERLKVCSVQLAGSDLRTIVCGAPNVSSGENVLVALPGAVLPDGTRLGRVNLRGVDSDGMILSEAEVELGTHSGGIIVLPDSLEPGEEAGRYLSLGDDVLELEVSPNRADCLSIYGVARELHAVTGAPLAADPADPDAPAEGERQASDYLSVTVDDAQLCPRFSARVFTEVTSGQSPLWLKARLLAAGQRPVNNVVDITNYVMLLLGQPMHAYDLDRLAGPALRVRRAKEGERLTTLDGEERCFDDDAVLVCDAAAPSGIGGIMGGAASEVSGETTRVVMEAATWNGPNILKTSSKLALRSEASTRFEKQLHPELALRAQALAARLMIELCGARLMPGTLDVAAKPDPPRRIVLRSKRVEGLLGEPVEPRAAQQLLERLGFPVAPRGGDLEVEVPYFRHYDVTREADLIEEVARTHGLHELPATLPARGQAVGGLTKRQRLRRQIENLLRDRGLSEAVTYSFISPEAVDRLALPQNDERRRVLHIANPLSEDQSAMRTTLLPGLLEAARHNFAHDAEGLALFEWGRVFFSNGAERLPDERLHISVLLAGTQLPKTWRSEARGTDFYVIKALLLALLDSLRVEWRLAGGGPSFLHAGRAAEVLAGGHEAGWIGELHPLVARTFGLDELDRPPAALELDLDLLLDLSAGTPVYEDLISYPAVRQDIAVVVDEPVEARTVIDVVRAAGGPELRSVQVFDLYRGEQLGQGKKSLALRLEFRAADRTLTDSEVAERREEIRRALAREVDGSLRE
jgi:phenylalanyl-tRNA synthetase beta chain